MANRFESQLIDQIVADVLVALRQRAQSAPLEIRSNGSRTPHLVSLPDAGKQNGNVITVREAVITEALLEKQVKQGEQLRIGGRAILTPTAKDYLRSRGIAWERFDESSIQTPSEKFQPGKLIALLDSPTMKALLVDVRRNQRSFWSIEMAGGFDEVVQSAISTICRGEALQVVAFVRQSHVAACRINRNPQCRAAVVRSSTEVQKVRTELGANVLCVSDEQSTFVDLRNLLSASVNSAGQIQEVGSAH